MRTHPAEPPLPLHTENHINNCPGCKYELEKISQLSDLKHLRFSAAAKIIWESEIVPEEFSERTHSDHRDIMLRLNRFFGELHLDEIHAGHMSAYQKVRLDTAGPELINHEVSFFGRVMDAAGFWKTLKPLVKRLKVPKAKERRVLSPEEEERLILVAATNPRWKVCYLGSLLQINTTAGRGEIRHIKVKNIDLHNRVLSIEEGTKNDFRMREYPMTDTIFWICGQFLKRYYRICRRLKIEPSPDHYVLPGRKRGGPYDPTRPMGSWKRAWAALTEKADLKGFWMNELRHHSANKLMEDPQVSDQTTEEIMGHGTKRMKNTYRHIRQKARLEALQRIEVRPAPKIVESVEHLEEIPAMVPTRKAQK